MNTASFDYAGLNSSVAAELESLRAEKQLLSENIRTTEQRLSAISLREEKLARLSESLTDLLTTYPPVTNHEADLSSSTENEKSAIEETSPSIQSNESALLETNNLIKGTDETSVNEFEIASPIPDSALDSDSGSETEIVDSPATIHREFNKTAFFEFYSHLEGAQQPIHVLAEKLLEYLGRPTKLRDLTSYILELGYRHHSQNFTNTVHTVLKNKRERNGGFYFDPKERMWELGHWRNSTQSTTTDKAAESDLETAEQSANQQTSQQAQGKKKKNSAKIKVIKGAARKR